MKSLNVEILMGHDIGVSKSYYKPTEREVLQDYLNAVPLLTINTDKLILQKQVEELTEKSKDNEYIIRGKLEENDKQIEALIKKKKWKVNFNRYLQLFIVEVHVFLSPPSTNMYMYTSIVLSVV
jgi:hypothetical protein